MLKLRYYFRLTTAFLSRFKGIIFVGIVAGILIFLAIQVLTPILKVKKIQIIGVAGRYQTSNLPDFIIKQISTGLTAIDSNHIVQPALATSWESPDKGKTWFFHLQSNVVWQDGQKVKSSDIVYQYSDVKTEYPDDKTIKFTLDNSYSLFPYVVAKPVFKKGLLGIGDANVKKLSLTGDFISELYVVTKSSKTRYKFYPTEERLKLAYKLGEVATAVSIYNPSPFQNWQVARSHEEINRNQVVTLFFNTKDALLSDKALRQALIYAINKDELPGERAFSPISPESYFYNPLVKKYPYDVGKAQETIKDIPDELKANFPLKLVSTPLLLEEAEKIADYWNKVGIPTQVQVTSVVPSDFQVYLTIFEIPKNPDQYSLWHSTQSATNIAKYKSDRIDKILEDARSEMNLEEQKSLYFDFQRFLMEDLPAAFLYHPKVYTIEHK